MWTYVASCDRLACDSYAEVKEEFDLPTGWYEVSVGLEKDRLGTGVSDTIGIFCTLEHAIETLQMRSTASQEHAVDVRRGDAAGVSDAQLDPVV